jgi:hypothetical protein
MSAKAARASSCNNMDPDPQGPEISAGSVIKGTGTQVEKWLKRNIWKGLDRATIAVLKSFRKKNAKTFRVKPPRTCYFTAVLKDCSENTEKLADHCRGYLIRKLLGRMWTRLQFRIDWIFISEKNLLANFTMYRTLVLADFLSTGAAHSGRHNTTFS